MTFSAIHTDLYQLTMAAGYVAEGLAERRACFHLFFRNAPFGGSFAIACGQAEIADWLASFRFDEEDLSYLAGLEGAGGKRLFEPAFLDVLAELRLDCEIDAVAEGTPLFPHEPALRVVGPLLHCQLLETPLLNLFNFPTLVATKAARICRAAGDGSVLEFGLRRAQGPDGGLTASRAAYVGGCTATSNVAAGRRYGIPVKGTHAHSWVTCFDDERSAFAAWSRAMPHNSIFLVDTYDSIEGVRNAIEAGRELRRRGWEMTGIRLDSGDLLELGIAARRLLDEAGFPEAAIVASNDLDEYRIRELRRAGSPITIWGVGTRLATAWDQPALGGVFKLAAIEEDGLWQPRLKLSEERIKTNDPGRLQVRRYRRAGRFVGDVIFDIDAGAETEGELVERRSSQTHRLAQPWDAEDLLQPLLRGDRIVRELPTATLARETCLRALAALPPEVLDLDEKGAYPVGLEPGLHARKQALVAEAERAVLASKQGEA